MKNIKHIRFVVQLLCVGLTIVGFFTDFRILSALLVATSVFGGAFVCGWVCPFGTFQDIFSKVGDLLGIKKRKMPRILQKVLVFSRYIMFALATFLTLDIIFQIISYDPRGALTMFLTGRSVGFIVAVVMVVFGLISMVFSRPFCNYLCIEGARYGAASIIRPFTIKRDEDKCVNCKKCNRVCPMNIEVTKEDQVTSPQCINCFNCVAACPIKGTMSYGRRKYKAKALKKYLVILSILLVGLAVSYATGLIEGPSFDRSEQSHQSRQGRGRNKDDSTLTKQVNSEINDSNNAEVVTINEEKPAVGSKVNGYVDGIYSGVGQGYNGSIDVQVTINDGTITKVEVTSYKDDKKWFNRAYSGIPDKIISAQSANVDTVGGATYSSQGIIEGVKDALNQAK